LSAPASGDRDRALPAQRATLLVWGFMGCGKSTIGRRVAEQSGSAFWDLDDRIEQAAGIPLSAIFEQQGEDRFRSLEREQMERVLDEGLQGNRRLVVALGGGTLLDGPLRARALDEAFVVTLTARPDTIAARTTAAHHDAPGSPHRRQRPLLGGTHPQGTIAHLLKQRASAYQQAHTAISTDNRSPAEVAEVLLTRWRGGRLRPCSTLPTS